MPVWGSPGQNERNREAENKKNHPQAHRPIRNLEKREDLRRDLNEKPRQQ
jgi:hypothetical protein